MEAQPPQPSAQTPSTTNKQKRSNLQNVREVHLCDIACLIKSAKLVIKQINTMQLNGLIRAFLQNP
jgi:hypothetical protein